MVSMAVESTAAEAHGELVDGEEKEVEEGAGAAAAHCSALRRRAACDFAHTAAAAIYGRALILSVTASG